jgi:hypothetical protein
VNPAAVPVTGRGPVSGPGSASTPEPAMACSLQARWLRRVVIARDGFALLRVGSQTGRAYRPVSAGGRARSWAGENPWRG